MENYRRLGEVIQADAYDTLSWQQQLDVFRVLNGTDGKMMSLLQLAGLIGVRQSHLSRVLSGERPLAGRVAAFLEGIQ